MYRIHRFMSGTRQTLNSSTWLKRRLEIHSSFPRSANSPETLCFHLFANEQVKSLVAPSI